MARLRTGLLWVLALRATSAAAASEPNPYLDPALRLYRAFEFEEALKTLDRALTWTNTPQEEVQAALLEGIFAAQLNKTARALRAFKRALALEPQAALPITVSPKIATLFERARKELGPVKPQPKPAAAVPPKSVAVPEPPIQAPV